MSAYEQRVEPPDKAFQYVVFAAEPYENIAFKIPNLALLNPGLTKINRVSDLETVGIVRGQRGCAGSIERK